ncbi:hypothetical protein ABZ853_23305 [Streptomyces albidoflavus]
MASLSGLISTPSAAALELSTPVPGFTCVMKETPPRVNAEGLIYVYVEQTCEGEFRPQWVRARLHSRACKDVKECPNRLVMGYVQSPERENNTRVVRVSTGVVCKPSKKERWFVTEGNSYVNKVFQRRGSSGAAKLKCAN